MEVSPLAEHIDFKEHYIAFIELDNFGIVDIPPEPNVEPKVNYCD